MEEVVEVEALGAEKRQEGREIQDGERVEDDKAEENEENSDKYMEKERKTIERRRRRRRRRREKIFFHQISGAKDIFALRGGLTPSYFHAAKSPQYNRNLFITFFQNIEKEGEIVPKQARRQMAKATRERRFLLNPRPSRCIWAILRRAQTIR